MWPSERDRKRCEALLNQIQRLMHERVMHAPIFEPATLHGVGPRLEEAGGKIELSPLLRRAVRGDAAEKAVTR
jgi:hypothetical protein